MMKTKWVRLFLCFTFIACGDAQLEEENSLSGDLEDVTNLSRCKGDTPAGTSLFNTQWRLDFVDKVDSSLRYQQIFKFDTGSVYMTLICSKDFTQSDPAQVQVASTVVGTQIHTLTQQSNDKTFSVGGELVACKAEIKAGTVLNFSFVGPCLRLREGNSTQILVPTITVPHSSEP